MASPDPVLRSEVDGAVALVTLNRPEVRNALDRPLMEALAATMAALDDDPAIRCIVLTGAGPAFCAGLDLRELGSGRGGSLLGAGGGTGGFWPPARTPVVAAVNGPAVTGGLEIVLQCDVRLASERARFADTHARVGVMPGGGLTVRLPRAIGLERAIEMSLTGRFVTGEEAATWGLVSRVVPHERLLDEAMATASAVAELDPDAAATILGMYHRAASLSGEDAAAAELEAAEAWRRRRFDPAGVEARRAGILARGRARR